MRIIAGENKGILLKAPPGIRVRPTADKVKGAIFNIIGCRVVDARILDLFAGTGSLGLEALSRGAQSVCFVDEHNESVAVIRDNISKCRRAGQTQLLRSDCAAALKMLAAARKNYDIIFCDPPYGKGWPEIIVQAVAGSMLVSSGGILVVEHPACEPALSMPVFKKVTTRKYGRTNISFYEVD